MKIKNRNAHKKCIIWTRVSTKHQEDNGGSLDDQHRLCKAYAESQGFEIKAYHGGTHESAKTPGVLVKAMISEAKRDKSITHIIVSQADRFSRSAGQAINIVSELQRLGITIVEAMTGMSTETPEGLMMIQVKLCMAQWDNTNRTTKFVSGRKNCLKNGVWCGRRPLGYNKEGKSINAKYTINATGKLIRKMFKWKMEGVANHIIADRIRPYGLDLSKQAVHKILTNPFYCGLIAHKMLEGEVVEGKHPPLISKAEFLRVQEILSGRTGVYTHKKETPKFPLKRYVRCLEDNSLMTAYTVKKKNIDYYKCNHIGCRTNVSAKKLHAKYEELLRCFDFPKLLYPLLRDCIDRIVQKGESETKPMLATLRKQRSECENKMKTCKTRYGVGDIDEEVYSLTIQSLQEKIDKIDLELSKFKTDLSNLSDNADAVFSTCCNLASLWRNSSLETSQKIQNLLFPDGIFWDKQNDNYRTFNANEALAIIAKLSDGYKNKKEVRNENLTSNFKMCG